MKYILIMIFGILIASCNEPDTLERKKFVEEAFPEYYWVIKPTNSNREFLVLDKDSSLWYIETRASWSDTITEREVLISLKK